MTSDESSPSVILVDDTAEALDIVRTLEDNGVRVIHAADTLAAESLLVTTFPDLIVLNLNDEGAPAFCDLISAIPRGGGVPVILLTEEDGTAPAEVATILRGAHAFVPRPAKPQELLRKVFTLLGHRGVLPAPELDGNPPDEAEDVDRHHESMSSKLLLPGAEDMALAATEASGESLLAQSEQSGLEPREPTQVLGDDPELTARASDKSYSLELSKFSSELPSEFSHELPIEFSSELPIDFSSELPNEFSHELSSKLADEHSHELPEPQAPSHSADSDFDDDFSLPLPAGQQDMDISGSLINEFLTAEHHRQGPDKEAAPTQPVRSPAAPDEPSPEASGRKDPSSMPPPARPERTAILNAPEGREASATGSASTDEPELSADFRRVIDEVAQRLFPEASPEDYHDGEFDELKTFVPIGDQGGAFYDDFDEFAIDMMETFSRGHAGLTIAPLSGVTERRDIGRDPQLRDNDTNDHATRPRDLPAPPPEPAPTSQPPAPVEPARAAAPSNTPTAPPVLLTQLGVDHGSLAEHGFPALLAACGRDSFDGQLVLRGHDDEPGRRREGGPRERSILFRQGQPLMARSTRPEDRLLEMMFRQGMLATEQYEEARHLVKTTARRPGAILVDMGTHTTRELFTLVRWHYRELIIAAFDWRQGTFAAEPPPARPPDRIVMEQSLAEILLEGLRRRYEAQELTALLGGAATCLAPQNEASLPRGLLEGEDQLVHSCDGTRPLGRVVADSRIDPSQALAILYGLVLLGHLAPTAAPEPVQASTPPQERGGYQRLQRRLQLCLDGDYFSLLGVAPNASTYEVRQAYQRSQQELTPDYLVAIGASEPPEQLETLRYLLREAYDVLSNEGLRQAYRISRFSDES